MLVRVATGTGRHAGRGMVSLSGGVVVDSDM